MIDLRVKGLPNTIKIGGKPYSIYTDFRYWLKFYDIVSNGGLEKSTNADFLFLFKNDIPLFQDFFDDLMDFFLNPNATPRNNNTSNERLFDYILDGEYIYASFMQVYGIDLTEVDMHWHKFKALFISLTADCKIGQIMSDRAYKKETKKYEQLAEERKREWTLPTKKEEKSIARKEELKKELFKIYNEKEV